MNISGGGIPGGGIPGGGIPSGGISGGGIPGGGIPSEGLPGGGIKPSSEPTGKPSTALPSGITENTKKAAIDISGVRFTPDTGLPAGGGSPVSTPTTGSNPADKPITVITPTDSHSKEIILAAVRGEYLYARLGLSLGILAIIGGVILGLNGVAGSTSWTADLIGLKSQVNDAAPGTVLFIIGLFMIWATRPKIKMRDLSG